MTKGIALLGLVVGSAAAVAQQPIKPHALGGITATSKEVLGSVTLARQLPNGSIIVNDASRRRLLLLDSTLQGFAVIADSTAGATNGYGQRPGALIPYVADSTLYLDATAGSLLVIDPSGKVSRVMSPPRPNDNNILASNATGFPGFDSKGRMVYRSAFRPMPQQLRDGSLQMPTPPDSAPLLRVDLDTRKADTIGSIKLARQISATGTTSGGMTFTMMTSAPLPTIDDWSLLSDGSIAILRGQDYHIDWILPDGSKKSTGRIPFDWKRLTDDDKLVIIDSITKARAAMQSSGGPTGMGGDAAMMMSFSRVGGGGGGGGRGDVIGDRTMVMGTQAAIASAAASTQQAPAKPDAPKTAPADGKSGASPAPAANTNAGSSTPSADKSVSDKVASVIGAAPALPVPVASDLPDYVPPFAFSSARPDADAHLWVRTTTSGSTSGSIVYDVIDNKGGLTDRVEVPRGMFIVGFGRGGIVFLTRRDADGLHLVRASIR